MKALYLEKAQLKIITLPQPSPLRNEALVKVLKAGLCNTDLELIRGYLEFEGIPGHEFVGQVVEAANSNLVGKRVVGDINLGCGKCEYCLGGRKEHCPSRQVLGILNKDGALAEYLTLPMDNLHVLPPRISDVEAVFIEPLAASLEILEQIRIRRQDSVLVLGDGKLGLLIAQVLKLKTPKVSCVGKHRRKLEILKEKEIETHLLGTRIREKFDIVVEATGNEKGLNEALSVAKAKGTIILKSTFQGETKVDVSKVVVDEIHLIGSRCGPFSRAIEVLSRKQVEVEKMVDGDFPLDRAKEAFAFAQKPETLKVLITP
ncbi:MAG: alcohol dehydrogenase catalytic domain-containing protein [Candidatus Aminicenantes bacterium]|nr:alcohol dehydrogenase catalytic domain-containing protein [Candidatus Aminicenantes bacterium]